MGRGESGLKLQFQVVICFDCTLAAADDWSIMNHSRPAIQSKAKQAPRRSDALENNGHWSSHRSASRHGKSVGPGIALPAVGHVGRFAAQKSSEHDRRLGQLSPGMS